MRKKIGAALGSAAIAVTISACGSSGDPSAAFEAAQQGVRDGDFEAFCDLLTPDAVDRIDDDSCAEEAADRYDGNGDTVNFVWDGAEITEEKIDGEHAVLTISTYDDEAANRGYSRIELNLVDSEWLIDNAYELI
jgi:hypothetical protein